MSRGTAAERMHADRQRAAVGESAVPAPFGSAAISIGRAAARPRLTDRLRILHRSSVNGRILVSMLTVVAVTSVVKLASVAKEVVVAGRFGAGDQMDAFVIAFALPSFAVGLVATGVHAAVIPAYVAAREREGPAAARELVSTLTVLSLVLLSALTLLLGVLAPVLLPVIGSGFSSEKLRLTQKLFAVLLPLVILGGFSALWGALLNAEERFALVSAAPAAAPLLIVALFWAAGSTIGIFGLPAGLLAGALIEASILALALRRHRLWTPPRWNARHILTGSVAKQFAASVAGALLMSTTTLVDQSMAAVLPPGSVAVLSYGNRLVLVLLGLLSGALSTAALPQFAALIARGDRAAVIHTLRTYLKWIALISVPATAVLMWLSVPITRMVFQRGAFDPETTLAVGRIQALYLIQVPFYLMGMLLVRLISALRANHVLIWGSAISVGVNLWLNYLFMRWMGVKGIALSTSVVYIISFGFLAFLLSLRLRTMPRPAAAL